MQAVFEKIIEKLEEVGNLEISMHGVRCNGKTLAIGYKKCIENAIEIVKQESERYNSGWIPCSGCADCEHKECENYGKV